MFSIEYLVQKTGESRRTIRYYIQRGLMPPPLGNRRGAYYTEAHLERLRLIKRLAEQGMPLVQIKELLSNEKAIEEAVEIPSPSFRQTRFERLNLENGIELNIPPGLLNETQLQQIRNFIMELTKENPPNE